MPGTENLKEDITEIKAEIKAIAKTLQRLAVQEERLQSVRKDLDGVIENICDIYTKINVLRSDHDTCSIGKINTDMVWIKWLTTLILAAIVGLTFSILKDLNSRDMGGNNGKVANKGSWILRGVAHHVSALSFHAGADGVVRIAVGPGAVVRYLEDDDYCSEGIGRGGLL